MIRVGIFMVILCVGELVAINYLGYFVLPGVEITPLMILIDG